MSCTVIIPAGGSGKRFGSSIPKQFVELNGIPIIVHTINLFKEIEEIDSVVVAVHAEWYTYTKEMSEKFKVEKLSEIIIGGRTRQDSVANALHSQSVQNAEIVLVHDAVRPFASANLIKKVIDTTDEFGAVIPATPPRETIKERSGNGIVVKTIERSKLCSVQTPQGFWLDIIQTAYTKANAAGFVGTDDASLVEFLGYKVKVIDGEDNNFKITTPLDLRIAELLLNDKSE